MARIKQPQGPAAQADHRRSSEPGEDAGTLTDEEYLAAGGPDAIDSATVEDDTDPRERPEPTPGSRRPAG